MGRCLCLLTSLGLLVTLQREGLGALRAPRVETQLVSAAKFLSGISLTSSRLHWRPKLSQPALPDVQAEAEAELGGELALVVARQATVRPHHVPSPAPLHQDHLELPAEAGTDLRLTGPDRQEVAGDQPGGAGRLQSGGRHQPGTD